MSIKDIPLSSSTDIPKPPSTTGVPQVPVPASFEAMLQTNKGPVTADPQSGSILKILSENGFKQKIEEGYQKGHTYTILHAAPSTDFTLIDGWTETFTDQEGNTISNQRKTYQFFKIVEEPVTPADSSVTRSARDSSYAHDARTDFPLEGKSSYKGEPTASVETKPAEMVPPTVVEIPISKEVSPDRAEEVANKIKRGGAGMTPEDWQYRNENWPAIEKFLMPVKPSQESSASQSVAQPVPIAEDPLLARIPSQTEFGPNGVSVGEGSRGPARPGEVSNKEVPAATPDDSKSWLMKKLGMQASAAPGSTVTPSGSAAAPKTSSYDLLKMKFAKPLAGTSSMPQLSIPKTAESELTPEQKMNSFIQGIFQTATKQWESAKNIAARAFIYPTEYAWGTDTSGNQIERSLENYPAEARKLREKVVEAIEGLKAQGTDVETLSINDAILTAMRQGILVV